MKLLSIEKILLPLVLIISASLLSGCGHGKKIGTDTEQEKVKVKASDPYLWLEEIEDQKALQWVQKENDNTLKDLMEDTHFARYKKQAEEIYFAEDRLPYGWYSNGYIYNYWTDQNNIRGVWRRTTLSEYRQASPDWEILLDLDQLAKEEQENWVYKGLECAPPRFERCLLRLSRGGKDAIVLREFDVPSKSFVKGGFVAPEAKTNILYLNETYVLIATDFGEGSVTTSGYPRQIRLWKRGQPLNKSQLVKQVQLDDLGVSASRYVDENGQQNIVIERIIDFENSEKSLFSWNKWIKGDQAPLTKLNLPTDAEMAAVYRGQVVIRLKSPDRGFEEGALVSATMNALLTGQEIKYKPVFIPGKRGTIDSVASSKLGPVVISLDNVNSQVFRLEYAFGKWKQEKIHVPNTGSIEFISVSPFFDKILLSYESFLVPTQLFLVEGRKKAQLIKQIPHRFRSKGLTVQQYFAESLDGTKVPYYVIGPKRKRRDRESATLLYGYGGFEVSVKPFYLGVIGRAWLNEGGVFVVANIRGGGEFGPNWHQQAVKKNRQKAFDDFIAVSQDLIRKRITSSEKLGIMGGSNGGLLVGVAMTQFPELYNAAIIQVPLMDMLRYHKLLAGASWMAEYGSPEDAAMREVLKAYSPYHNLKADKTYPQPLLITSTKDDRVHPGHARKMVAKMKAMNHPVYYYENTEGGHSAAANLKQRAFHKALEMTYLRRRLGSAK